MLKFYKFCFGAYKLALLALIIFSFFGDSALGFVGESGLDIFSLLFIIFGTVLIVLGLILQFVHLSYNTKHALTFIITSLIFITVLYDAYWLYDSISVGDYSLISAFLLFFTILAAVSFYAVFTKKISP
jgi:hypothetical protein